MKWKILLTPLFTHAAKGILKVNPDDLIDSIEIGDRIYKVYNDRLSFAHHENIAVVLENIEKLKKLRGLDLQHTGIESLPESINMIVYLQTLNLHGNRLKSLPNSLFEMFFIRYLNIGRNMFSEVPENIRTMKLLNVLGLSHCGFTSVPSWIGELTKLTHLNLSGNKLKSLPKSIANLTRIISLDLTENPDFAFASPDGNSLGSLELIEIFKDKVKFSKPRFHNEVADFKRFIEYCETLPLYWNFKVLKKSTPRNTNTIDFEKMINIINHLTKMYVKNNILDDRMDPLIDPNDIKCVSNYLRMLYDPRIDSEKLKVFERYSAYMKGLFSDVLMHFENFSLDILQLPNDHYFNFTKYIFSSMANAIRHYSTKPICAMKGLYTTIQNDFSYRSCNAVDFIKNRIEALKEYKFNLLMETSDPKKCYILNYWTRELGSILGFRLVFENEMLNLTEIINGNHLWNGLGMFLNAFTPENIINILTDDVNKNHHVINGIISIINEDNSLCVTEKEGMVNCSFITHNAIKYMLVRLNYLINY